MWRLIVLFLVALGGFWFGKTREPKEKLLQEEPSHIENRPFVIALYLHNEASWCKRALRSIFEQDYPAYRVFVIDDASIDDTEEAAKDFIVQNHQDEKVIFIRNDAFLGYSMSLKRILNHCEDFEIVIPIDAKNWFSSPNVLNRFNVAYQNPDVLLVKALGIGYPSYKIEKEGPISFSASLFRKMQPDEKDLVLAIEKLAAKKMGKIEEPLQFLNQTRP